jgi:DHA1 family multidrug resistance protein-like MFS transporter
LASWQRTLYIVWLTQFIALAGGNLVFPFLPLYIRDLGVDDPGQVAVLAGLTSTATGVMLFIFSPIWGSLADRYGRKPLLMRAYIGATVTMTLQGLAQNVWQLIALRAVQGAFVGTVPAAAALVASNTPPERVAYAMGLLQVAMFTSQTAGPLAGGVLAESIGFRETFLVTGTAFAIAGALLFLFVKEEFVPPAVRRGPLESMLANVRDVAASRSVLTLIGLIFLINATLAFARPLIPLFVDLLDPRAHGALESGYVFAALAVTSAGAAFIFGAIAHRIGYKRMLLIAVTGAGLAYLPVAAAGSVQSLVLMMAVVGCFSGAMMPAANALLSLNSPPDKQGSAFGLAGSANALAFAVSPLLGGITASLLGIRAVFLVIASAALGIAGFAGLSVKNPETQAAAQGQAGSESGKETAAS